jgi:hypothetical protein
MNVEIEWRGPLPPVRLFQMLSNGEINVIALLASNEARVKEYDYPKEYFFTMEAGIALAKDNKLDKVNGVEDIINLKLGFFKDGVIAPAMCDKRIQWDLISTTDWQAMNLNKVLLGRIDAAYNPESKSLIYESEKMGVKDKFRVLIIPGVTGDLYSVFSKKDNGKYLALYNDLLKNLRLKETYKELLSEYL